MYTLICYLKTIYRSLWWGWPFTDEYFDGHEYETKEVHEDCQVEVSKCNFCGKIEISWCKTNSREAMQARINNKND